MLIRTVFLPFDIHLGMVDRQREPENQNVVGASEIVKRDYDKIFCIGLWKTGTTSVEKLLRSFGFSLGDQVVAEMLYEDWLLHSRADRIVRYCHTADAFQDTPFMFEGLYKELDKAFPKSKFILTVRDSADQWFSSLSRFHTKLFSSDKTRVPTTEDLATTTHIYKGWLLDLISMSFNYPSKPLYDPESYKEKYLQHNESVKEYFKGRENDFIVINVGRPEDFNKLIDFLNVRTNLSHFPWENKT